MWFEKEGVDFSYKMLLLEFCIAVLFNVVLNFWWAWLITLQVYRVVTRGGANDKEFCVDSRDSAAVKKAEGEMEEKQNALDDD